MLIRTVPPKLIFNSEINKLEYGTYKSEGLAPIYYIEDKNQSVVGIEIIFSGGKLLETKKGVSFFSTNLLKSGVEGYDTNEISEFFELRGAFVQVQSGLDHNSLSLYCLSEKLNETLPFFLKLITSPTFPRDQLEKLVKKKEQELDINEQKSSYWSTKLLKQTLFENHPYGHVMDKEGLKSITQEDLVSYWGNPSLNQIQFITAAGNFNFNNTIDELESIIKIQSPNNHSKKEIVHTSSDSASIIKKLPNNEQSSLKIGINSINLKNPDYQSFSFGNTLFGGYFGSRLMQSIREEKGLTYGINSSIVHLKQASYIQISADLKIGVGNKVIDQIKLELENLIDLPITENELDKVKSYLIGEYKSNTETIFDKISKVKFLKLQELPDSYYIEHFKSILELDFQTIQESLKKYFKADSFNTVLVE